METDSNQQKKLTWRDIKAVADSLTEGQLDMPAIYSIPDVKDGTIESISIADEDHYTDDEFIQPESDYEPGYIEEHELERIYKEGQPFLNVG